MTKNRKLFAKGFRHGIPIGLGYLSVAFTFGMKAVADGLSPLEALLISMTNVTSAVLPMQNRQLMALHNCRFASVPFTNISSHTP